MSTVQRAAKNTGIVITGNVIFRLISLLVIIYLARYLGTAGFGKYSFVFAYLAFFGIITDFGLQDILVREMSRDASMAPKLIGNAYGIRLILTVFAFVLSIIIISVMSYPTDTTTYIYIASFTLLFISFSDFYATIFQAKLKMEYPTIAKLSFKIISTILIFKIIFSHGTLMQVIIALVFSELVKTLINYYYSRKFLRPQFEIDFELWKYLFKEMFPIALTSVIWVVYFRIDVVMLSAMIGDTEVGLYSAAYKLSEPLSLIPYALTVSLFPIMSKSFITSKETLITIYRLGVKYLLIVMLPIAFGTTLIADKIIFLIYGPEFFGSTPALQILIWALLFTSTNRVLTHLLISVGKQKLITLSSALCAVFNVIANFILIPILSYNGAAIATVMTTIIFLIVNFYFVSNYIHVLPVHKIFLKPLLSCLIMSAFVYYFIDANVFSLVLLAAGIYLMALIALKTLDKEDIGLVKRVLNRK